MPVTQRIQPWPSPENCQLANQDTMPFHRLAVYLSGVADGVPAAERETLMVSGVSGLSMSYTHTLTDAEVTAHRYAQIRESLRQGVMKGSISGLELNVLLQQLDASEV